MANGEVKSSSESEISVKGQSVNNIQADTVTVRHSNTGNIKANNVLISQAGPLYRGQYRGIAPGRAQTVSATCHCEAGWVVQVKAENLSMVQGGMVFAETKEAIYCLQRWVILAGGDIALDQVVLKRFWPVARLRWIKAAVRGAGATGYNGSNTGVILMIAGGSMAKSTRCLVQRRAPLWRSLPWP